MQLKSVCLSHICEICHSRS